VHWVHYLPAYHGRLWRVIRLCRFFAPLLFDYNMLLWWIGRAEFTDHARDLAFARLHSKWAPRLFDFMVDLGGIWVKLGQFMSLFTLVMPAAYTAELKKLQGKCPPREASELRKQVEDQLGRPVDHVFRRFDDASIGVASLSQVHRACLQEDGREVVVKVQLPDVAESVATDLAMVDFFSRWFDAATSELVREVKEHVLRELDFKAEATSLEIVSRGLQKAFPSVQVPQPVAKLCTPTMLVMTFVPGVSIVDGVLHELAVMPYTGQGAEKSEAEAPARAAKTSAVVVAALYGCRAVRSLGIATYNRSFASLGLPAIRHDPIEINRRIWEVQGHQLFTQGFFNTDAQAGNFLVHNGKLGIIDFGQMCSLGMETRVRLARLFVAFAEGDDTEIAKRQAQLGTRTRHMRSEQLRLHAIFAFGFLNKDVPKRREELDRADPLLCSRRDPKLIFVERMLWLLRGLNVYMGIPGINHSMNIWPPIAQALLAEHGAHYAVEDATTERVHLDIDFPSENQAG